MSSVTTNTGAAQGSAPTDQQTYNVQQNNQGALQQTQQIQGAGSDGGVGVLGASTVLSQAQQTTLQVDTGGATSATQQTTTPVQPSSFSVPGAVTFVVGLLLICAAISFVWSRRNEVH